MNISREQADAEYAQKDALYTLAKTSECVLCGRQMAVCTRAGEIFLACPADHTHQGHRKRRSGTQIASERLAAMEKLERKKKGEQDA